MAVTNSTKTKQLVAFISRLEMFQTTERFPKHGPTFQNDFFVFNNNNNWIISLAYYGSICSCPNDVSKEMDTIIMQLYWSSKPDKIKRETIRGLPELGGTGLINITCKTDALKLNCLQRYTKTQGKWKYLFDFWIQKANNDQILVGLFSTILN